MNKIVLKSIDNLTEQEHQMIEQKAPQVEVDIKLAPTTRYEKFQSLCLNYLTKSNFRESQVTRQLPKPTDVNFGVITGYVDMNCSTNEKIVPKGKVSLYNI